VNQLRCKVRKAIWVSPRRPELKLNIFALHITEIAERFAVRPHEFRAADQKDADAS
jgi:hypothetical protein